MHPPRSSLSPATATTQADTHDDSPRVSIACIRYSHHSTSLLPPPFVPIMMTHPGLACGRRQRKLVPRRCPVPT